ncbi:MAG: hypothetical protein E7664_04770 [Ruminococcaceae bacterium]|nr:hypothetical protein [Oscillospiraceae bacterium]
MSRVSRAFRLSGRLIKFLFTLLIAFVCGMVFWRLCSSATPKEMERLVPNDALYEAYEAEGESLYVFRQEQRSITSGTKNYGYFSVEHAAFVPSADQVQIALRYNNSTIRALCEDYGLEQTPSREDELFDITLVLAFDLTPEDETDNATNDPESVRFVRCHADSISSMEKNLYNYRKVVFDLSTCGVDLADVLEDGSLLAVYCDVYYAEDVDYEAYAYGTLCLYDYKSENLTVKVDKATWEALKTYGED